MVNLSENSANGRIQYQWEPETPFLTDVATWHGESVTAPSRAFAPPNHSESPFVSEYLGEYDSGGERAEMFAGLVSELSDQEFTETLDDLVNEAIAVAEENLAMEGADPAGEYLSTERAVGTYLEPIGATAERMLEGMAERLATVDVGAASEAEIDALIEQSVEVPAGSAPVAEAFLGGIVKKAKKAVKAVKKVASKVASALPHAAILKKLATLVRPLLEQLLRVAIDRVPVALQPVAKELAKRFLGISAAEALEEAEQYEAAAIEPELLAEAVDAELAGSIMDGEDFDREAAVRRTLAGNLARSRPLRNLARARRRFAQKVVTMKPEEPVEPVVEEFVPAVLAALKLGISILGRPKVVKALSGFVANFIKKYVGDKQANALSYALVDAGLRLVNLEATETEAAGYALGTTVEDTITRLVQDAPAAAWENEALLESYALEAFQHAASSHFPDSLIRSELHESTNANGAWVALPANGPHKNYKKYSRVLDITITPQSAAATRTFGGIPLRAFLADRLGVNVDKPLQARIHLYEAISGTTLGLIAAGEKNVALLGSSGRAGRSLLHPLTPEAASTLLSEPGLARAVDPQFVARRTKVQVGQRFYFLEVPGAQVRQARKPSLSGMRPARSSQTQVVLDFPRRELRVRLFFAEKDAQNVASLFRRKAPPAAVVSQIRTLHEGALRRALSQSPENAVKMIHEAAPTDALAAPLVSTLIRTVGSKLSEKIREWLAGVLGKEVATSYERFGADFENATSNDADGVTLTITFQAPPLLEKLRRALKPGGLVGLTALFGKEPLGSYSLTVSPGLV